MLYAKYRPQLFSDLISLDAVKKVLVDQIKTKNLSHAYLFHGPKGTGKTTTARLLAKGIMCRAVSKDGEPCNTCSTCLEIQGGNCIDLIEIDAASNRGIDDIRELKRRVSLAPASHTSKVYIIDEVHMLTKEAFNALLKTLEEPPKNVVFILCTTEIHKVPDTIISRCQKFHFTRASVESVVEKLKNILKLEETDISDEILLKIAAASSGGYRDAETILDQVLSEGTTYIDKIIGVVESEIVYSLLEAIIDKKTYPAIVLINEAYNDGMDLEYITKQLLELIRKLMLEKMGVLRSVDNISEYEQNWLALASRRIDERDILDLINIFTQTMIQMRHNGIPQLPLEMAIFKYSSKLELEVSQGPQKQVTTKTEMISKEGIKGGQIDVATWEKILTATKPYNHSLEALLRGCQPKSLEKGMLTLNVCYKFHKEKLDNPKYKQYLGEVISKIIGENIDVIFELDLDGKPPVREEKVASSKMQDMDLDVFSTKII